MEEELGGVEVVEESEGDVALGLEVEPGGLLGGFAALDDGGVSGGLLEGSFEQIGGGGEIAAGEFQTGGVVEEDG